MENAQFFDKDFNTFLVLLISCLSGSSAILDDNTCEYPCWRGISIGRSTKAEVEEIVNNMPDIINVTHLEIVLSENQNYEEYIKWEFKGVSEYTGYIYFLNNISTLMVIEFSSSINLPKLLIKFGDPFYL